VEDREEKICGRCIGFSERERRDQIRPIKGRARSPISCRKPPAWEASKQASRPAG